eukprot:GSChrysophyteH1.ASY1.ANO1.3115.1 assembled CDS
MESSLVVDIGSSSTKVGWSGEDLPSSVLPSVSHKDYAKYTTSVESPHYNAEAAKEGTVPSVLMHRGVVQDWDGMEKYWQTILNEVGVSQTNTERTPVLLIDSPSSSVSDRVKWAEILFEGYRAPSICIGNSASLSIFAAGRTTGVVVDCGAGLTTSVPVFEGLALTHACTSMEMGGMECTVRLQKLLKERAGCSTSLVDSLILKERFAYGVADVATKVVESQNDDFTTVNLPDGREVQIETRYFGDCTEQLISNEVTTFGGLSGQVCESLVLCDDSIRKDLARNIIISGGTSMLPGLGARLEKDLGGLLRQRSPGTVDADGAAYVYPSADHRESGYTQQRQFAAWVGGSIFASFDSFKQLRVTKQEWEESMEAALLTKCF